MVSEYWHRGILEEDLPVIKEELDSDEDFDRFIDSFESAIESAKYKIIPPSWQLIHNLVGWSEYKLFLREPPPPKVKPQMRLVFQYDAYLNEFYVLGVGFRNSEELRKSDEHHSIYYISGNRLEFTKKEDWIKRE